MKTKNNNDDEDDCDNDGAPEILETLEADLEHQNLQTLERNMNVDELAFDQNQNVDDGECDDALWPMTME